MALGPGEAINLSASRRPQYRVTDCRAPAAKSIWQLFYAGSVGSQSLVGIPRLWQLRLNRESDIAVWPFDSGFSVPDQPVVLVEVYPSLLGKAVDKCMTDNAIKDKIQVQVNALAVASLDQVSGLTPLFDEPGSLSAQCRAIVAREEGWIFGLGFKDDLIKALQQNPAFDDLCR